MVAPPRPLNQFCCGCPLSFGAVFIIALNLIQNAFYIFTATSNIILKVPTMGVGLSLTTQTLNAMFCVLGLPFIFAGIYGVLYRQESHIRLYLYYLVVTFALDLVFVLSYFLLQDICQAMPSVLQEHGSAFACGFMRTFGLLFVLMVIGIEGYFMYAIWSFCEDLHAGGSGAGLPSLLNQADKVREHRRYNATYQETLFGQPAAGGVSSAVFQYGAFQTPGMGGSTRVYGNYHEQSYPPADVNRLQL